MPSARFSPTAFQSCWYVFPIMTVCLPRLLPSLMKWGWTSCLPRILTTDEGLSFDLFQLMDQHGDVLNELMLPSWSGDLSRPRANASQDRRSGGPCRVVCAIFQHDHNIRFTKDPDKSGSVLHVYCNDRPGLCHRLRPPCSKHGVQVHNARIATFGERVEDTFLSARRSPAAELEACDALTESLKKHIKKAELL